MLRRPLLVVALAALPAPAAAQTTISLLDRLLVGGSAQLQIPLLEDDLSAQLLDLGARIPLGAKTNLLFELPLIRASADDPFTGTSISKMMVANPYVGFRMFSEHSMIDLGVRLPLIDVNDVDELVVVAAGAVADFDRLEAYLPDYVPLRAMFTRFLGPPRIADGMSTRIVFGPTVFIGQNGNETEAFADYGLAVSHATPRRELQAAFSGRFSITDDGGSFGERSQHHLHIGATLRSTGVRPTFFIRIPLDAPVSDAMSVVLGAGVVADLR